MRPFLRKRLSTAICLGMCAALLGCATGRYGDQITRVNYYPACYAPLHELRQADKSFNRTIAVSSSLGAIAGAVIGLLASDGKPQGALVGAAAGGALGAGVGYAKAKQDRIADDNQRMASYLRDIQGDISGLDRASAAARAARDCYNREFASALAAYKAGVMSRAELQSRYEEIRDGCTEASAILGTILDSAADREREYREAIAQESQRANGRQSTAGRASATPGQKKTAAPRATAPKTGSSRSSAASLDRVTRSADQLNRSRQTVEDERETLKKMQEEMDGELAAIMA